MCAEVFNKRFPRVFCPRNLFIHLKSSNFARCFQLIKEKTCWHDTQRPDDERQSDAQSDSPAQRAVHSGTADKHPDGIYRCVDGWLAWCQGFGVDRYSTVNYVALWRSYIGRCHGLLGAGCPLYRCQRLCKGAPGVPSGHNGHGALHTYPYRHMPCHSRSAALWLGGGADIAPDASRYFAIFCMSLPVYQLGILSSSMLKSSGNMRVPVPSAC